MLQRRLAAPLLLAFAAATSAGDAPEAPPVPPVLEPTPEELKNLTAELDKATTDKNDEQITVGLLKLETLKSDAFAKYVKDGVKSANAGVRAAAIRAAATYGMKDAEKDVRKVLHPKRVDKNEDLLVANGEVVAAAIDYLARLEIPGEEKAVLDDWLVPLFAFHFDDKRVGTSWALDLVRASIHYLGKTKNKRAVPHLVAMVGEPKQAPASRNSGDPNPPEAYWKARQMIWNKSSGWARWALKEITGQQYQSAQEWEAWLKMNKKDYR